MLLSEEELKKSAVMDPSITEFIAKNPMPPLDWSNPTAMKAIMKEASDQGLAMVGAPEASLVEEYKDIPMRDGFQSSIKIHRPATTPAGGSPLIVFNFGGGFVCGDNNAGTPFARGWVRLFGAVVVSISYRLAPEHKFPTSWHDAIDSAKWISDHAADLHADPSKGFIIGGISAGGNLSAVVTLASISENWSHRVTGQWLCVPALMDGSTVPDKYKSYFRSLEHNQDVPILPSEALTQLEELVQFDKSSALRFPVLNKEVPLSKLPPTFFQSDGLDPLRDDALIYEEMLKEAGVPTRINFYPGCPHAHFAMFPGLPVSNLAVADIMTGMGWLLGKSVSPEQGLGALAPVG